MLCRSRDKRIDLVDDSIVDNGGGNRDRNSFGGNHSRNSHAGRIRFGDLTGRYCLDIHITVVNVDGRHVRVIDRHVRVFDESLNLGSQPIGDLHTRASTGEPTGADTDCDGACKRVCGNSVI